jgi:hypothetical protein
MLSEAAAMSPEERKFVRLYVQAMRRDYVLLRSVIDLMNPHGLGVKNFVDAVRLALSLSDLEDVFETNLRRLQRKHGMNHRRISAGPTTDELADIFSLSFFKVITTEETDDEKVVNNAGWFSGKPTEWKKTFLMLQQLPKPEAANSLPELLSDIFTAALKLFPFHANKWQMPPDTKKIWPPQNTGWPVDDEFEDEDDDDENPFDWFFNSDE